MRNLSIREAERESDRRRAERQRNRGEAASHEPSCGLFDFLESELGDTCESDGKEGRETCASCRQ